MTERFSDFFTWVQAVWLTGRGKPLEFHNRKYLIDIYRDQHPEIVYTKAAQMGLSERMLAESVWICDQLGKNCLYTFPTQSHLQDFVQARLEPVLMHSQYLTSRIGADSSQDKKVEKIGLKRIGRGFLYLRGSQNEKQIITIDADCCVLDERDRFMESSVPYIDKRTLASDLKWRREVSTPTLPGIGIDRSYAESDQRVWMITCAECGYEQELDFFKSVDFENKTVVCTACKKELDRLSDGRWVPQRPDLSKIHGYKINGLYNPQRTILELIEAYEKAKVSGYSELQQFYNQVLGLPYEIQGQSLHADEVLKCKGTYLFPVPQYEGVNYAGADIGVAHHNVIVINKIKGHLPRLIWVGTVRHFLGPYDSIEAIIKQYKVRVCLVDKRPEVTKVKELMDFYPSIVYAAEYTNTKFTIQEYFKWDDIKHEAYLDRTISIDYLVGDITNQKYELPRNIETVEDFIDQITSSVRITERDKNSGVDKTRWIAKDADHYMHAWNYARMAALKDVTGEALLDYYRKPQSVLGPDLLDWIKINSKRLE